MKIQTAIDIGSQTVRILIAQLLKDGRLVPVFRDREIVRLGEEMAFTRELKESAIERAVNCILLFSRKAAKFKSEEITAVATACVRNAVNASFFLEQVKTETGILPFVISGLQEAFLISRGVENVIGKNSYPRLIIDIGGGSTEIILSRSSHDTVFESLPLGVISLCEKNLIHDPPEEIELNRLKEEIISKLQPIKSIITPEFGNFYLSGTAGTLTTLASMDMELTEYCPEKINGHILHIDTIRNILLKMLPLPSAKRALLPGLEKGREIVIIAGAFLLLEVMKIAGCSSITVSDSGILEGIIIEKSSPSLNIFNRPLNLT